MDRILSHGAGRQTTAIAVLAKHGKIKIDLAIFSDTKCEKPETYWYLENYTKDIFHDAKIPFQTITSDTPATKNGLFVWLWNHSQIPSIASGKRLCSTKFKRDVIEKHFKGITYETLIGFSSDEAIRATNAPLRSHKVTYPLIELNLSANDCWQIIKDEGLPMPLKSSCFFCPFQHPIEWNWLKNNHRNLFDDALSLESRYHERRPDMEWLGLMRGYPLRRFKDGLQPEMFGLGENSCWEGHCGH